MMMIMCHLNNIVCNIMIVRHLTPPDFDCDRRYETGKNNNDQIFEECDTFLSLFVRER